ncbi:hypothetical protein SASPL_154770 [Salvia splendens]|uniref:U-box domain-containing protein n=1 Tax=Salvia splendens TaxID=180675 RepID=A0A8X8YYS1_SALSN|nr:hypothetical protein SASPL_154770 [Salvia splendens]
MTKLGQTRPAALDHIQYMLIVVVCKEMNVIYVFSDVVLRVSEIATDFSVSILLKIVREKESVVEALQARAFQKLLVVLQIRSDEVTKEKVTELLKVLKGYRSKIVCVEYSDFKHLRRPF